MGKNSKSDAPKPVSIKPEHMPKYITKPTKFYCPVSPYILWHHDLIFQDCPLGSDQRDMSSCLRCTLRGDSTVKIKGKKNKPPVRKKATPKVEKRHKEPTPNIGKTYVSE